MIPRVLLIIGFTTTDDLNFQVSGVVPSPALNELQNSIFTPSGTLPKEQHQNTTILNILIDLINRGK